MWLLPPSTSTSTAWVLCVNLHNCVRRQQRVRCQANRPVEITRQTTLSQVTQRGVESSSQHLPSVSNARRSICGEWERETQTGIFKSIIRKKSMKNKKLLEIRLQVSQFPTPLCYTSTSCCCSRADYVYPPTTFASVSSSTSASASASARHYH